jgi:serine protein kinase
MLKLAKEFLYDLLGARQERQIKPKKFPQIDVDEVLIGHTNNPEYEKLRTTRRWRPSGTAPSIDVPYLLEWSRRDQGAGAGLRQGQGPAAHRPAHPGDRRPVGVLTRLQDDKDGKISLVEKAKLYDGKSPPRAGPRTRSRNCGQVPRRGHDRGVSARYVQDKISNCLSSNHDYINPFMVLNELKGSSDLAHHQRGRPAEYDATASTSPRRNWTRSSRTRSRRRWSATRTPSSGSARTTSTT